MSTQNTLVANTSFKTDMNNETAADTFLPSMKFNKHIENVSVSVYEGASNSLINNNYDSYQESLKCNDS